MCPCRGVVGGFGCLQEFAMSIEELIAELNAARSDEVIPAGEWLWKRGPTIAAHLACQ